MTQTDEPTVIIPARLALFMVRYLHWTGPDYNCRNTAKEVHDELTEKLAEQLTDGQLERSIQLAELQIDAGDLQSTQ